MGAAAIPTIGAFSGWSDIEPKNPALPNAKTPPSAPTSQYPWPPGATAIATTGALSGFPPCEPKNSASPRLNTPPSRATCQ
ncbi:MAG TPA: hypothetical protein VMY78_13585 [Solirubrobacteraceae bacterium]|nr:hypothetical protein [Solirubrobacteraceae bacterium]